MKLPFTKFPPGSVFKILGKPQPYYAHKIKPAKWSMCNWEPDDPNDRKASMTGVVLPALRAELLRIIKRVGFRKTYKRKLAPPHHGQKYQYVYRPRYKADKTQFVLLGHAGREPSGLKPTIDVKMLGNRVIVGGFDRPDGMFKTSIAFFYDDPLMLDKFEAEMLKLYKELE